LSSYITTAGLTIPTLTELRQGLEASYQAVWGLDVDLSPEGYLGQHIALMSKRDRDLWEMNQELLAARDPDTASGVSLDEICAETGVTRLAPTAARATNVLHWLTLATVVTVPAGSKVKAAGAPTTYALDPDVVGVADPTGAFKAVRLKVASGFADGNIMRVIAGGIDCGATYDTEVHGTVAQFIEASFAPLVMASIAGAASRYVAISGSDFVEIVFPATTAITTVTGLLATSDSYQGVLGNYTCDLVGVRAVDAYTLDTIATPITGWDSITQSVSGANGTDTETDTALRLRRLRQMRSGTATEDAIRNALLRVDGVSFADVTSNRENDTDAEGRPAHWLECVVEGGNDTAVASAIWTTAPGGIGFYGNFDTTPTDLRPVVTGADGKSHRVNFSRPQPLYAWVQVLVTMLNPEEELPADMGQAIKEAIVAWGTENMGLGDDMIRQKFYSPIFTVGGVTQVTILHALTASAGDTPMYSMDPKLAVSSRHYATFALDRVVVA